MSETKPQLAITMRRSFCGECPACGYIVVSLPDTQIPNDEEWYDHAVDYPNDDYADFCLTRPKTVTCNNCKAVLRTKEKVTQDRTSDWR